MRSTDKQVIWCIAQYCIVDVFVLQWPKPSVNGYRISYISITVVFCMALLWFTQSGAMAFYYHNNVMTIYAISLNQMSPLLIFVYALGSPHSLSLVVSDTPANGQQMSW